MIYMAPTSGETQDTTQRLATSQYQAAASLYNSY